MKYLFTLIFLGTINTMIAETYQEKKHFSGKAYWQCPNKKRYPSEEAATRACGDDAELVDEEGNVIL